MIWLPSQCLWPAQPRGAGRALRRQNAARVPGRLGPHDRSPANSHTHGRWAGAHSSRREQHDARPARRPQVCACPSRAMATCAVRVPPTSSRLLLVPLLVPGPKHMYEKTACMCSFEMHFRVTRAGFEPAISTLRGWRPGPLDERAKTRAQCSLAERGFRSIRDRSCGSRNGCR